MLRNISYAFFFRVLTVIASFLLVVLVSNYLGAEGRGIISLLITDIFLVQLLSDYIGGTPLVYMTPRYNLVKLIIPAYLWNIVSCIAGTAILYFANGIPNGLLWHVFFLSLINGVGYTHLMILLGKENIFLNNALVFLKSIVMLSILFVLFSVLGHVGLKEYIITLYIGFGVIGIFGGIGIRKYFTRFDYSGIWKVTKEIFRLGIMGQTANVFQFLNYRFSYFLLENFSGTRQLGIYSNGVNIAETTLLLSKSIASVIYARVANIEDREKAVALTFSVSKLSFIATLLIGLPFFFMPEGFYRFVFGNEFGKIAVVMVCIMPGILANGLTTIYNQYFSGIGKYSINLIGSLIGLIMTITLCYALIPRYGIIGAGIAASVSYFSASAYTAYQFYKHKHYSLKDLMPSRAEIDLFRIEFHKMFPRKSKQ